MLTNELNTIFLCLYPFLDTKTYRQLFLITQALLAMTGRITMLNISRWAGKGASYRTIQRFFASNNTKSDLDSILDYHPFNQ